MEFARPYMSQGHNANYALFIAAVIIVLSMLVHDSRVNATQYREIDELTRAGSGVFGSDTQGKIAAAGRTLIIAGVSRQRLITYLYQPNASGTWSLVAESTTTPVTVSASPAQSVATDGEYAVIGSPYTNHKGFISGSVNVLQTTAGTWNQSTILTGVDTDAGDLFGSAVDIEGSQMVIGAPGVGGIVSPYGFVSGSVGAAYVFRRDDAGLWNQTAKLSVEGMSPSGFARAVAISGSTAVVGCWGDNGIVGNIGSVYVFQDDGFGTWDQVAKLRASDLGINYSAHFGTSVSMSGSRMIVGATGAYVDQWSNSSGAAYIFEDDGSGNWIQVAKLAPDGPLVEGFGFSVSMEGSLAVIGAYKGDSRIGNSTSAAYIFRRDEVGSWHQIDKLVSSDPSVEQFGTGVETNGRDVFVAGRTFTSPNTYFGSVYVFAIPEADGICLATIGGLGFAFSRGRLRTNRNERQ